MTPFSAATLREEDDPAPFAKNVGESGVGPGVVEERGVAALARGAVIEDEGWKRPRAGGAIDHQLQIDGLPGLDEGGANHLGGEGRGLG